MSALGLNLLCRRFRLVQCLRLLRGLLGCVDQALLGHLIGPRGGSEISIYIYMCTHICIDMYKYVYAHLCTYMCTYIYIYLGTYIYICVYICTYCFLWVFLQVSHVSMYTHRPKYLLVLT